MEARGMHGGGVLRLLVLLVRARWRDCEEPGEAMECTRASAAREHDNQGASGHQQKENKAR